MMSFSVCVVVVSIVCLVSSTCCLCVCAHVCKRKEIRWRCICADDEYASSRNFDWNFVPRDEISATTTRFALISLTRCSPIT